MIKSEVTNTTNYTPCHIDGHQTPLRVLYLDDDDIDRTLMQMHIKRHLKRGVELVCVDTLCSAKAALSSDRFDYFVTDNRMPPIDHYRETLDQLDLASFEGRIIVVSSETHFECFDSHRDERVHTVIDKADLSQAIKNGLFQPL